MKIVQICSHYDYGGAARIAASLHRKLLEAGEESYVAYGRGQGGPEPNLYCFDKSPEIYFSAFMSRFVGLNGYWNQAGTRRLLGFLEKVQPDLIHLHIVHGYYLNFRLLFDYIYEKNLPVVWTFHDCHAFTGNCGHFYDCRGFEIGCGKCPYLDRYPTSQFFDFTAKMWRDKKNWFTKGEKKILVTPAQWLKTEVEQSFLNKYPVKVIPNGIDTKEVFYPKGKEACREKHGFDKQEKIVLGIATSFKDPLKGATYLLDLAKRLGNTAKVVLIGWDASLEEHRKGLENVIPLPSMADRKELAEYYSLADVFVLPSMAETYATVTLEAQACGTPVVGFAVGGNREQLQDKKGIAVPVGDKAALAAAVEQILTGEANVLTGEALAQKLQMENSLETMAKQYFLVYREAIEE